MSNYESGKVEVFPSTLRKLGYGKFTSEQNFANIILSIVDKNSYIVGYSTGEPKWLSVVINGYYFKIDGFNFSESENIYLHILEDSNGLLVATNGSATTEFDKDGYFYGITIDNNLNPSPISGCTWHTLQVVKDGTIFNDNIWKFKSDSISFGSTSLNDELNNKQYIIHNGKGIKDIKNIKGAANEVAITDEYTNRLDSLPGKGNEGEKLFYFDDHGVAQDSNKNIGGWTSDDKGRVWTSLSVIGGEIASSNNMGQRIFISTTDPQGGIGTGPNKVTPQTGDIWFKYQG